MRAKTLNSAVRGAIPGVDYDQKAAMSFGDYANDCYPGGLVDVVLTALIKAAEGICR